MDIEELSDDELDRLLRSGEARDQLEGYFGAPLYNELSVLASDQTRAGTREGAVFVLPGIMGSKLSVKTGNRQVRVWVNPFSLAAGGVNDLKWKAQGRTVVPSGVFHFAYQRMRLSLRREGYDASFLPYDWRAGIEKIAAAVSKKIEDSKAPVRLVAHSMGGLVARKLAALHGPDRIESIVTLGTPNFGSYSPVTVMRLAHSYVAWLARLDQTSGSTPKAIVEKVLRHFPGLLQMMPSPEKRADEPFFEHANWPKGGVRPLKIALEEALTAQSSLPLPDRRFTQIIGYGQPTIVGADFDADGMTFREARTGDGTVPMDLAQTDGTTRYYVEEKHGRLASNRRVIAACSAILRSETPDLESSFTVRSRHRQGKRWNEDELRTASRSDIPRTLDPESFDPEKLLTAFAAAPDVMMDADGGRAEQDTAHIGPKTYAFSFSEKYRRRLNVDLVYGNLLDVGADAYLLGVFEGVVTLGGAARAIDTELGRMLERLMADGQISGRAGEVTVIPIARHLLKASYIVVVGLGRLTENRDVLNAVEVAGRNVMRTLCISKLSNIATVLLAAASGPSAIAVFQRLFSGFYSALSDWDEDQSFSRIQFCEIDQARCKQVDGELRETLSRAEMTDVEIIYRTRDEPERYVPLEGARRPPQQRELLTALGEMSGDRSEMRLTVYHTSGAGNTAALAPSRRTIKIAALETLMGRLRHAQSPAALESLAADLERLIFEEEFRAGLPRPALALNGLQIACDPWSSRIPWETLHARGAPVATRGGVDRWYLPVSDRVRRVTPIRRDDAGGDVRRHVLLVADPNPDRSLTKARVEGEALKRLFHEESDRFASQASIGERVGRSALVDLLSGGQTGAAPEIFHYAGHAFFDPQNRRNSGLELGGEDDDKYFVGTDVAALSQVPAFVFLNACESNRVRKGAPDKPPKPSEMELVKRNVGLAEAFLLGGVAHIIGTYWPVPDDIAERFSSRFYERAVSDGDIGTALRNVRRELQEDGICGWTNFIHYGNPHVSL